MTILNSKLPIPQELIDKSRQFAKDSVSTNLSAYARRGQSNVQAIERQIMEGKVGEEMSRSQLISVLPKLSLVDFNIYEKKDKSWDPDLKDELSKTRIAVKSQNYESAQYYHESWVFQFNDGRQFDCDTGIFGKDIDPNHYVCMVLLNMPKKVAQIRACVKVQWLRDNNMFQPMALSKFSSTNNKLAVYYDHPTYKSLSHFPIDELWQL